MATTTKKTATKKTTTTAKKVSTPKAKKITQDAIRRRAEEIYFERVNRGRHGDQLSDWLQAESELNGVK